LLIADENKLDVDDNDDDEYMNAAAAHAAFVITVSATTGAYVMHSTRAT